MIKITFNLARITLTLILLLLPIISIFSQSTSSSQSQALLEIDYKYSEFGDISSETIRIYADGRYVEEGVSLEQAKSGKLRKV